MKPGNLFLLIVLTAFSILLMLQSLPDFVAVGIVFFFFSVLGWVDFLNALKSNKTSD